MLRRKISKCEICANDEDTMLTMLCSHCPWVDNCIGVNNHKHFILYVVFMIIGIGLLVQLTITCEFFNQEIQSSR